MQAVVMGVGASVVFAVLTSWQPVISAIGAGAGSSAQAHRRNSTA